MKQLSPKLKCGVLLLLLPLVVYSYIGIFDSFDSNTILKKDLVQDFLAAKAILNSIHPYDSTHLLAEKFLPGDGYITFAHPTPHPPSVLFLTFWLGFFTYKQAGIIWTALQVFALFASFRILFSLFNLKFRYQSFAVLFAVFFSLSARPVNLDLILGQFAIFLLLSISLFFYFLNSGRMVAAGVALGFSLSLKFFGVIILPYLILKHRYKAFLAAVITFAALNGASLILIGKGAWLKYFTIIAPSVSAKYQFTELNISLWTLGNRLFSGMHAGVLETADVEPLFYFQELAYPFSFLMIFLFLGLLFSRFLKSNENAIDITMIELAQLVAISTVITPVAWVHYLVLLLVPMFVLAESEGEKLINLRSITFWSTTFWYFSGTFRLLAPPDGNLSFFEGQLSLVSLIPVFLLVYSLEELAKKSRVST